MRPTSVAVAASAAVALAPGALAWGALAHTTVGFVAQSFVSSTTASWAQDTLGDSGSSYLASIATYADEYRGTTAGKWSAPLHFIDANDSPPSSCSVDYNRDCGASGCVVSAIANYTQRAGDNRFSVANRKEAIEFLVHFLGDVTQPLHDEATALGGNDIDVTFDGSSTNLHATWDTKIPEKAHGSYSLSNAQTWADSLVSEIKSGSYASQKDSWLSGMDVSDPEGSATAWAVDANAYVCSNSLAGGESSIAGTDLGGDYYNTNLPVVELQVAKAGYRLAAWLNLINDGTTGL